MYLWILAFERYRYTTPSITTKEFAIMKNNIELQ